MESLERPSMIDALTDPDTEEVRSKLPDELIGWAQGTYRALRRP
jgi:hypothetical protein